MVKYQKNASYIIGCLIFLLLGCTGNKISTSTDAEFIELPDGTKVVLNKGSDIEYTINETTRFVELNGEAFFKVKKSEVPFVVHTQQGEIKVLGTAFNVKSCDDELEVEVDEGSVDVETAKGNKRLRRGEKAFYNEVKGLFEKGHAEFKHHIWTNEFKNDMRNLGKEIEKGGKQLGKELRNVSNELKIKF